MTHSDGRLDAHVDEMSCLLYLDGQLESDRARNLASHVEACAECRRLLSSLERETHLLHEALVEEDEAVPARLLAPSRAENISWGWIGAAGAAAAGLYGIWNAVAQPWLSQFRQVGIGQDSVLTMLFFSGVFWKGWSDMLNVMELLSMGTVAVLLVVLLRRNLRRFVSLSALFAALLLVGLALPGPVHAAEFHHSSTETYTLPAGTTVHTDLVVGASTARIDGTVEGDLVAGARTVTISGHVLGDMIVWAKDVRINGTVDGSCICAAQTIQINGRVGGSVRAFAQVLLIEGSVEKNLMAWAQLVEISSKGTVGGSVLAGVESFLSDGRIEHDMSAAFDKNDLNGYVGGKADLFTGRLTIGPQAQIRGSARYDGAAQPEVSPQAKLASPLAIKLESRWKKYQHPRYYWSHIIRLAAAFVLGLVFLFVLPGFFSDVEQKVNRIGASLGFGAVALVAVPILSIIACFTLVGIPVAVVSIMLYIVVLYAAQILVGTWLGERLLGPGATQGARIGRLALGLSLLRICFVVPYLNALVTCATLVIGLGAVILAVSDRIKPAPAHASA